MIGEVTPQLDILTYPLNVDFPDNAELAFKFWVHEPENNHLVVDAVKDEAVIALEYFTAAPDFEEKMEANNAVLCGDATRQQLHIVETWASHGDISAQIAVAYPSSNKRMVAVDSWIYFRDSTHPTQQNFEEIGHDPQDTEDAIAKAYQLARWSHGRERIAAAQLSNLAWELRDEGVSPRIAVIYGLAHTPLFHLARSLGVAAEREIIGKPENHAIGALAMKMRWSTAISQDNEDSYRVVRTQAISDYASATVVAADIMTELEREVLESHFAALRSEGLDYDMHNHAADDWQLIRDLRRSGALLAQRINSKDPDLQRHVQKILKGFEKRNNGRFRKQQRANLAKLKLLELVRIP